MTKEIVYPTGAEIDLDKIEMGDNSLNSLEKWISEYQEQDTILVNKDKIELVKQLGKRENIGVNVIGKIVDTSTIKVKSNGKIVVDLPLDEVVGDKMAMKDYVLPNKISPIMVPNIPNHDLSTKVKMVFGLTSVGSKRFLTNKVDRSVTGLVAQQQCVGPTSTPLSNFGIIAQSHFQFTGAVTSIGERPNIGTINSANMAKMAIGEMLTNMVFAKITNMNDIRCSGNWM